MDRIESMTKTYATDVAYHAARIQKWAAFADAATTEYEKRFARQLIALAEVQLRDTHRRAKNKLNMKMIRTYLARVEALQPTAPHYLS